MQLKYFGMLIPCLISLGATGLFGQAQQYALIDLGTLGGTASTATAINNSGQITGYSSDASGVTHAFLYENGVMRDLGTFYGGASSFGMGINDRGVVTGYGATRSTRRVPEETHAFVLRAGQMRDLGTLGGSLSGASAINNAGQIAGTSTDASGQSRAFLWSPGQDAFTDIGTLGGTQAFAWGMNDLGQVAGQAETPLNTFRAFVYSNGVMVDIGNLGYDTSLARAVNNTGLVVGYSATADLRVHAFLFDGAIHDLTATSVESTYAYAIANDGTILGTVVNARDKGRAVIFKSGATIDLNTLIPAGSSLELMDATAINDKGQIVGNAYVGRSIHAYRLDPLP